MNESISRCLADEVLRPIGAAGAGILSATTGREAGPRQGGRDNITVLIVRFDAIDPEPGRA